MPVVFEGESEYKRAFKSVPKKTFISSNQLSVSAGVSSCCLENCMEPPIQRKKRASGPTTTLSTDFYEKPGPPGTDFVLLGNQDKFSQNVVYGAKNRHIFTEIPGEEKVEPVSKKQKEKDHKKENIPPPIAPNVDTSKFVDPPTPMAPREPKKVKQRHAAKVAPEVRPSDCMNEYVQTDLDKGIAQSAQEATADYSLKYKAGIAPPRPSKKVSEYRMKFDWKEPADSSPLLTAENVVYNQNSQVAPFKPDAVPKVTEYKSQFKEWKLLPQAPEVEAVTKQLTTDKGKTKKSTSKKKRSKSVGASPKDKRTASKHDVDASLERADVSAMDLEAPPHARVPRRRPRQVCSEYQSNFHSPSKYSYINGAWKGADPPQIQPRQEASESGDRQITNWFAEVIELRRKADEYRKRCQTTYFSQQHLSQLRSLLDDSVQSARTVDDSASQAFGSVNKVTSIEKEHAEPQGSEASPRQDVAEKVLPSDKVSVSKPQQSLPPEGTANISSRPEMKQKSKSQNKNVDKNSQKHHTKNARKEKVERSQIEDNLIKDVALPKPRQAWTEANAPHSRIPKEPEIDSKGTQTCKSSFTALHHVPLVGDDGGRITTPKMQLSQTSLRRHHLDRTTPSVGGAILTSPESTKKAHSQTRRSLPAGIAQLDLEQEEPESMQYRRRLHPDIIQSEAERAKQTEVTSVDDVSLGNDSDTLVDEPADSRQVGKTHDMRRIAGEQTYHGKEGHRDERPRKATSGKVTKVTSKLGQQKQAKYTAPRPAYSAIDERWGQTYNKPYVPYLPVEALGRTLNGSDGVPSDAIDEDILSVSARSVASSCSLASEVLERARKRTEEFWGKGGQMASR